MTTYGITGATGKLGRLAIRALLDEGVPGASTVAGARSAAEPPTCPAATSRSVLAS